MPRASHVIYYLLFTNVGGLYLGDHMGSPLRGDDIFLGDSGRQVAWNYFDWDRDLRYFVG